jgi:diguanylate cyclase (GGDEF)-like protein
LGALGRTVALVFRDLANLKHVNASLVLLVGDLLFKRDAQRFVSWELEPDFIARLGSDEFAIISNTLNDAKGAFVIAQIVEVVLRQLINLEGTEIFTTASVSITLFPEYSSDPDILLQDADMGWYQA